MPHLHSPYASLAIAHNVGRKRLRHATTAGRGQVGCNWAQKAVAIDPDDADAHAMLAVAASWASSRMWRATT